jgi:hypothetical protein
MPPSRQKTSDVLKEKHIWLKLPDDRNHVPIEMVRLNFLSLDITVRASMTDTGEALTWGAAGYKCGIFPDSQAG